VESPVMMHVLPTDGPGPPALVDLANALGGDRPRSDRGRSGRIEQPAGGGQNLLVVVKAGLEDVSSKGLSILGRRSPEVHVQVRRSILVAVEPGLQQAGEFVPSGVQPLSDRVGGAGHRALGHVLEPITCTGRKGTDDNGDSVKLARIHSCLQFRSLVASIVPSFTQERAGCLSQAAREAATGPRAALQRTWCRTGIPLRADSRALRLCLVPLPSTDGRWGSD